MWFRGGLERVSKGHPLHHQRDGSNQCGGLEREHIQHQRGVWFHGGLGHVSRGHPQHRQRDVCRLHGEDQWYEHKGHPQHRQHGGCRLRGVLDQLQCGGFQGWYLARCYQHELHELHVRSNHECRLSLNGGLEYHDGLEQQHDELGHHGGLEHQCDVERHDGLMGLQHGVELHDVPRRLQYRDE